MEKFVTLEFRALLLEIPKMARPFIKSCPKINGGPKMSQNVSRRNCAFLYSMKPLKSNHSLEVGVESSLVVTSTKKRVEVAQIAEII